MRWWPWLLGGGLLLLGSRARAAASRLVPPASPDRPGRWFSWAELGDPPEEYRGNVAYLVTRALDPLRDAWGGPLAVVSGWRSEIQNQAVGGAPRSQHLVGLAADLVPVPGGEESARRLHAMADSMQRSNRIPHGGLGLYLRGGGSFVHVDVRGYLARWTDSREA